MPPWGRPPGGRSGVGRYMEEVDDVYRFQELDSDDEKNGVTLDPAYHRVSNGKQQFNPDELYFNDMDIRAWERRTAELGGLAYGEDYPYQEDEGYYDDAADVGMSAAEYEELLFQRVLNKIRVARATGDADVQLTPEELQAYQTRLWRQRAPAAHPQAARARPVSAPIVSGNVNTAVAPVSSVAGTAGASSQRSKKSNRRSSIFGSSSKPKKEKSSGRTRAPSTSTVSQGPSPQQSSPGFWVQGSDGQPVFMPIQPYQGRMTRDAPAQAPGSPSRQSSRSASVSSEKIAPARGVRQAQTPPRITPPREIPGAFPGSPVRFREPTPPQSMRPTSSSSRQSNQEAAEPKATRRSRSSSKSTPKLVPFPVQDYKHYNPEAYNYQYAGQMASPQSPQYARRVVSGPADPYAMPRRVPVPAPAPVPDQRAAAVHGVQGSHSDPTLAHTAEMSEEDDIIVDVLPQADDRGYKVSTARPSAKEGSNGGSSSRDGERRRRSGRSRRKH